jgi:FMN phosphatase YigB (HAD superfamily)
MFLDALSKCGCEAKDTVFIDDNPANIAASAKFGITPVLIAATPGTDHDVPFLKIHSLSELL